VRYPPLILIGANQVFGALLIAQAHLFTPGVREPSLIFMLLALIVASLSGFAGLSLIRGNSMGRALSLVLQAVQVVGAASPSFSLRLELGVKVTAEVSSRGMMTHWGFAGLYGIWPIGGAQELTVFFNAVAIVAFVYLWRTRPQGKPIEGAA